MYPDPVRGHDDIADLPGYGSPNRLFRGIDLLQYVASTLLNDSSQLGVLVAVRNRGKMANTRYWG